MKDPGEVREHHDLLGRSNEGALPSLKGTTNNFDNNSGRVPPGSSTILVLGAVAGAVSLLSVLLTVSNILHRVPDRLPTLYNAVYTAHTLLVDHLLRGFSLGFSFVKAY